MYRYWLIFVLAVFTPSPAWASTISAVYEASYKIGDKDVTDLVIKDFNFAMKSWRQLLPSDKIDLQIFVKPFADLGGDLGGTIALTIANNLLISSASIQFNKNTNWFFDDTPDDNNEFEMKARELNKNPNTNAKVNSGRWGDTNKDTLKNKIDFLSVAEHELGHALGLSEGQKSGYTRYKDAVKKKDGQNVIDIDPAFAALFPDNQLPVMSISVGGPADPHFTGDDFANTLMKSGVVAGRRVVQSDIDILAIGSIDRLGKNGVKVTPVAAPEPGTLALLTSGVALLSAYRGRRRRRL